MTDTRERQISDLLALRDGELSGAAAAQALARPGATDTLERIDRIRQALKTLPDPAADPDRILQITAAARLRVVATRRLVPAGRFRGPGDRWIRYAAAAGLVLVIGAGLVGTNVERREAEPEAVMVGPVMSGPQALLNALHERSKRLEPLLATADRNDPTAQALRLRIADLDAQIAGGGEEDLGAQRARRLWGQRVALLESLAEVRRAQATLQPAVY